MNERLRELRLYLNLSQKKFGERIFLSPDQISSLETGRRSFTDRVIRDICNEFNVNDFWLVNGEGQMLKDPLESIDAPNHIKDMLSKLITLNEKDQLKIMKILDALIEEEKEID